MSENGAKHVSGDVMSSRVAAREPAAETPPAATADNFDENSIVDDDNLSILSDESEDFELPETHFNNNNNNVIDVNNNNNRRGFRELNNLGPIQNLSRLRSGRI